VDRFAVRVVAGTRVRPAPEPPGSLPAAGKRVQVVGRLDGEVVTASEVTILPDPVVENMVGTIKSMPATGALGLWEADVAGRGRVRFMVTSPSVVDTRAAPAAPEMRVYLRLQDLGDGSWMALRVRVDWSD
jgi:hypothetical protein